MVAARGRLGGAAIAACLVLGAGLACAPPPAAAARADFDGDGFSDVAVASPYEEVGEHEEAGVVGVVYGSRNGLAKRRARQFDQHDAGGAVEADDYFGETLATGDFNGDGRADLAVGAPLDGVPGIPFSGAVDVLYGSPAGLTGAGAREIRQDAAGGRAERGDGFGASLAAGDFDGDGTDDLAVGAMREDVGSHADAGAVNVLYGSPAGLTGVRARELTQRAAGGRVEDDDWFGSPVAAGNFDGRGPDDLAVGAGHEDVGSHADAGAVDVLYGSGAGLTRAGAKELTQDDAGGRAEPGDRFGSVLATGRFDRDRRSDLAVGVPYEDVRAAGHAKLVDAGAVDVVYGSARGLSGARAEGLAQEAAGGRSEPHDEFGYALAAGDLDGTGATDLAVGTPFEDVPGRDGARLRDAGVVQVLHGSTAGLATAGAAVLDQRGAGGAVEAGDCFGFALTSGDYDGAAAADLAVGAPFEAVGRTLRRSGVVNVLYDSPAGLGRRGTMRLTQDAAGGVGEPEDTFGLMLR